MRMDCASDRRTVTSLSARANDALSAARGTSAPDRSRSSTKMMRHRDMDTTGLNIELPNVIKPITFGTHPDLRRQLQVVR